MASTTFDRFGLAQTNVADRERASIFRRTRKVARESTESMFVMASRGFPRGEYPPTQKTQPSLPQRRHSIDVNTGAWNRCIPEKWATRTVYESTQSFLKETNPPLTRECALSLPDIRRYVKLQRQGPVPNDSSVFLELEHSSIMNNEYHLIMEREGESSWFCDNILNVALELVSKKYRCRANDIEIGNALDSFLLWQCGQYGDADGNDFAHYAEQKKQFEGKKFIFLPINDGYVNPSNEDTNGTHWSLLVVNRMSGTAHYVDSLYAGSLAHQDVASTTLLGLRYLLDDDQYVCHVEYNAPNQYTHNRTTDDWGPCGPFVYEMIKRYLRKIQRYLEAGMESAFSFDIPEGFATRCRFDSHYTRWEVQQRIADAKACQIRDAVIAAHDTPVLHRTTVSVIPGYSGAELSYWEAVEERSRDEDELEEVFEDEESGESEELADEMMQNETV
jgi:hypothetical protein